MKTLRILMCSALLCTPLLSSAEDIRLGRYIDKKSNHPSLQYHPMQAPTRLQFPIEVRTVGDAVTMALDASGYGVDFEANPETYVLFTMPLPQLHRDLGTLRLIALLQTLAGPGYEIKTNDLLRTVSFDATSAIDLGLVQDAREAWLTRNPNPASAIYKVHPGDSVSLIAAEHGVPTTAWPEFINAVLNRNPHAFINHNPDRLRAGVDLELPL